MSRGQRNVRRAVILAAGESRRLEILRLNTPKPMIEVGGKPLLARHLENCAAIGIKEVFINLYYLPEQIRDFVGDGSRWNLQITCQIESQLAGTSGGVKGFADLLKGEPFLVIYGDNYCTFSFDEVVKAHLSAIPAPDMSIALFHLNDTSASGVADCRPDDSIESFIEKPPLGTTKSHWVNSGVYVMEPALLDLIPEGVSDFGHDVIPQFLAAGKRILGIKTAGRVLAVDTPELLRGASSTTL